MLAERRLRDVELLGDEEAADAVLDEIAIGLAREMRGRILQPFENGEAALIGKGLEEICILHFVILRSNELMSIPKGLSVSEITPERIAAAEEIIRPHIRRTPVMTVSMADFGLGGGNVDLKLECLQHSGSFKARGAFTNLLTRDVPAAGVVAASGGNHGAAVAYAARKLGIKATIFVPSISAKAKTDRIRSFDADLVIGGDRYADALAASETFAENNGALQVHAFNQPETLIGQGTLGKEIEDDLPDIDTLLVAVGGGGLIGGIAAWYRGRVKIVAVEPEEAPTLNMALAAGHPVDAPAGGVAADSLAPKQVGELMFPIARDHVALSVLVTDEAIRQAQKALWDNVRIATEPGGAAAMAAILSGRYVPAVGERVAVLVCGSNTTAVDFG
jgi:threonine dehydratase